MVWDLIIGDGRVIEVKRKSYRGSDRWLETLRSTALSPIALHINKESRIHLEKSSCHFQFRGQM